MDIPVEFRQALIEADKMLRQGRVLDAEHILNGLTSIQSLRHIPLEALADLYLQQRRFEECLASLRQLVKADPTNSDYSAKLSNLLNSLGQTDEAINEFCRILHEKPDDATVHFNLAILYRKQHRFEDALSSYETALRLGIDHAEEVYSNMGNIYSEMLDAEKARKMYERALEVEPEYVPALFNLAGHFEESGEKQQAIELYEKILSIDPRHWKSVARLAYPRKITEENQDIVDRILACIRDSSEDSGSQEVLYFSLGKAYDDLEQYDKAAEAFVSANELSRHRVNPYSPEETERAFEQLIELCNSNWIEGRMTDADLSPIFICGMYRSGSTLLERMLAGHPAIAAGGELDTLPWLISRHLGPFPQGLKDATREQLRNVADAYGEATGVLAPEARFITDKRPDNFLRLGVIRAAFPAARMIHTRRNIRDNCLSIYFQQFSRAANYANDLQNIAHYYRQQERLMAHWRENFPDSVCSVDYEELVESPDRVLRRVLEFLGLEWNDEVLNFQQNRGLVKTYSIWQVREGLHSRSRDRWRNYRGLLGGLAENSESGKTGR